MNWFGYIYKTINLLNGKVYIGQRKGPFDRSYHGSGTRLLNSIKIHGRHNFKTEVLSFACTKMELDDLERQHIRAYRNSLPREMLYNISDGGAGEGRPHSEETRRKIGESNSKHHGPDHGNYGIKRSDEFKRRESESRKGHQWNLGHRHSIETRRKLSIAASLRTGQRNAFFGRHHSEESKKKISDAKRRCNRETR